MQHKKVVKINNEKIICIYKEKFYICKMIASKAKIIEKLDQNNEYKGNLMLAASIIDKKNWDCNSRNY